VVAVDMLVVAAGEDMRAAEVAAAAENANFLFL
jgi:hypothetical protein